MTNSFQKLAFLLALASLILVLLIVIVGISCGQGTGGKLSKLDISGTTLDGEYLTGLAPIASSKLIVPSIAVYRANADSEDITVSAQLLNDPAIAQAEANRQITVDISGPFPSPGEFSSTGLLSQSPQVSSAFTWNYGPTGQSMSYALIKYAISNLNTALGAIPITTYILILPQNAIMYVMNGLTGYGIANPPLIYPDNYPDNPVGGTVGIDVNGLSPFVSWKTMELDGKPLTQSPCESAGNPGSGGIKMPPPGTWTKSDSQSWAGKCGSYQCDCYYLSPEDLTPVPVTLFLENPQITDFIQSYIHGQRAWVSLPSDIKTGYHDLTLIAQPYAAIPVTGNEGRTLTVKFLLFGPTFTLDKSQVLPGDTLNVTGSGFAPVSKVKIYTQTGAGDEVEIGSANTDSTGSFTQQVNIPAVNSDFMSNLFIVSTKENGTIRVQIDDPDFQARYSSVYITEIVNGVYKPITYIKPAAAPVAPLTAPPAISPTAPTTPNIPASPAANPTVPNLNAPSGVSQTSSPAQPPTGVQVIDHTMASNIDETTGNVITRTSVFYNTDSKAYSWLNLSNVVSGTLEWKWYSPNGLYYTTSYNIPNPSGAPYWESYDAWHNINIAGTGAANLPGNWHVDVSLNGQYLLSENFVIEQSSSPVQPSAPSIAPSTTQPSSAVQILDHTMASNVDESTNEVIQRASVFVTTDSKAYSWLSLGNVGAGTVQWIWYSPDGGQYSTGSVDIPAPTNGAYWSVYNVWYYIPIAGSGAATSPGNWHVDIYLNGQKLLTEQFALTYVL